MRISIPLCKYDKEKQYKVYYDIFLDYLSDKYLAFPSNSELKGIYSSSSDYFAFGAKVRLQKLISSMGYLDVEMIREYG